jgi:rhamnulokinase
VSSQLRNDVAGAFPTRASVAVDLGAGSCRVSLLRWSHGAPSIEVVHRFPNAPITHSDGTLLWPLETILHGVEDGLRLCAERAPEGIQSIGVDGWSVDYVRLGEDGRPLEEPFCYRDERNKGAQQKLHEVIPPARLRELTGLQLQQFNTLYQLFADRIADRAAGKLWLNLPEYLLSRWSGEQVSEYTNATHTQMIDVATGEWSGEILRAARIDASTMPRIVDPGTVLGHMRGPFADLPAFRETLVVAPACHDTASAIAGIPAEGDDWGYISCGTWSLVGTPVETPHIDAQASESLFTNIGLDRGRFLFQKNMNGLWLLTECMQAWSAEGKPWDIVVLCDAARSAPATAALLDLEDPDLQSVGNMPQRINTHLRARGEAAVDPSSAGAPAMAAMIFRSLAAQYKNVFSQMKKLTGKSLQRIYLVGGGSRNVFLRELIAESTGREVIAGSAESSTVGNFVLQLVALGSFTTVAERRAAALQYAKLLCTHWQPNTF